MADIGHKKFVEFQTLKFSRVDQHHVHLPHGPPHPCERERGQVWILLETKLTVNNNPLHPRSPPRRRKEKLTDGSITHTTRLHSTVAAPGVCGEDHEEFFNQHHHQSQSGLTFGTGEDIQLRVWGV